MNQAPEAAEAVKEKPTTLAEIALVFLKLGTTAFGGPAAHIAMMEDEFVRRRRWLTRHEFLDRLGASNLIPGPSSTEMAIFIGHSQRGWAGLVVAGCCFIIPAAVLVSMIAAAYVRFGSLPRVEGILYAMKPAVIAIIIQALWNLARTAVKTKFLALVGAASAILSSLAVNPLLVLAFAGLASGAAPWLKRSRGGTLSLVAMWGGFAGIGAVATATLSAPFGLARLFLSFAKIGAVVFGSGYVLLAFLRAELIVRLHWLTEKQLIDAVAVGQFTPGPVFTTATFIGYVLAGIPGAFFATLGIFAPGFFFVAVSGPLIPKIRRSSLAGAVLDGVVVGSLALMGVVAWQLGRAAVTDWLTVLILLVSAVALLHFRLNSAWLVGGAALVGWLVKA